jgi:hypothetical protein
MSRSSTKSKSRAVVLSMTLMVTACAQTTYVGLEEDNSIPGGPTRTVGVQIDRSFMEAFPDCTIILEPEVGPGLERFRELVTEALDRHLTRRFTRVIDAVERRSFARQSALDLRHRGDQRELAEIANCDTLLQARVVGPGKTYLVVWSQLQIGLEITMINARDHRTLWRARHMADRSEGGIPFSPLGIVVDAYSSVKFSSDHEIGESVIDDAVRRIVRSLPNLRMIKTQR